MKDKISSENNRYFTDWAVRQLEGTNDDAPSPLGLKKSRKAVNFF